MLHLGPEVGFYRPHQFKKPEVVQLLFSGRINHRRADGVTELMLQKQILGPQHVKDATVVSPKD
jgi:hypothetical protein